MHLPIHIATGLKASLQERWKRQFLGKGIPNFRDRTLLEGLWRRTQDQKNSELSGWQSKKDARRRIVHYLDHYVLEQTGDEEFALGIDAPYLWLHLTFPRDEIHSYEKQVIDSLKVGGWNNQEYKPDNKSIFTLDDLIMEIEFLDEHPEDMISGRNFPRNYKIMEITIRSDKTNISPNQRKHPWGVLRSGFRTLDVRGNPEIVTEVKELAQYLPAQIELGAGASIEAGIPPLHFLHQVYQVSNTTTHQFLLDTKKDTFLTNLALNPSHFYKQTGLMYAKSLTTQPTPFYHLLRRLHEEEKIVGPIITNNFDGLLAVVGLPEHYVRRYDETHIMPHIDFHPQAKSLIVIGSHADRRKIQHSARAQGLKVIYIDPEGYRTDNGFVTYPLESPQTRDIVVRMTSGEFTNAWIQTYGLCLDNFLN